MAKIKDIRKWGFPEGSAKENSNNPFMPVLKRMLKTLGVGYYDECCNELSPASPLTETLTVLEEFSLSGNVVTITYKDELGVSTTKTVDLSTIVPNLEIASGSYDDATNTINFVTADGTVINVVVDELTIFTSTIAGQANKHQIGTYQDENEGITPVYETVTSLSFDGSNLIFVNEDGSQTPVDITSIAADCCIASASYSQATGQVTLTKNDGSTISVQTESLTTLTFSGTNLIYTDEKGAVNTVDISGLLAAAISNSLVNDGNNTLTSNVSGASSSASIINNVSSSVSGSSINISVNGVSAPALDLSSAIQAAETDTTLSNTIAGNKIGTYTNEAGTAVDINETITSISSSGSSISYTNEAGASTSIDIKNLETTTSISGSANLATGVYTVTYVNEDGVSTSLNIDICALKDACIPTPTVFSMGYHPTDAAIACADAP